jgi:hypothetical protein
MEYSAIREIKEATTFWFRIRFLRGASTSVPGGLGVDTVN